jgi:hypothetical protein
VRLRLALEKHEFSDDTGVSTVHITTKASLLPFFPELFGIYIPGD